MSNFDRFRGILEYPFYKIAVYSFKREVEPIQRIV